MLATLQMLCMKVLETRILFTLNEETFKLLKSHRGKLCHYTLEEKLKVLEKAK